ncbi:MAG: hypothetical protein H6817_06095, partial [Phycisphaerales bacterium]|nr:hypothetical protein [Phycisphaerales bacterium]
MSLRWGMVVGLAVLLVGGGCGSSVVAQITGGSFTNTASDVVPRYFHAASMLSHNLVMVTGGLNLVIIPPSLVSRNNISFYDPMTGTFTTQYTPFNGNPPTTPTLLTARSSHTQTTLLDGRVLITGGHENASGTSPGTAFAGVELFDPITGLMSAGPSMSAARAMHTATPLPDGRVVVAGGSSWQVFDPGTNSWSSNKSLARSRIAHAAVLLADYAGTPGDDRVLLIGGGGNGPNTLELIDVGNASTTLMAATLTVGVDDLAAIELADGRVFIAGGQSLTTGDTVADAYVYDPVLDVLTPVAD